ncbi:HD domain-containing protein [Natrialba aegyptia]|uniref:Metal dependent phosphohydrolase n=1 Tax=Natrialba aegyptia DSM 13077 TaxID=1227491 RepID=M0B2Z3_9EURY|nr:HD domain-containing protein [Natrialba aegyptia]ELZ05165.1 metal dependent phosphohydrolase [Natrialba aegyptia DSM 13077]
MSEDTVRTAFPELDTIEDDDLRARVVDAWTTAIAENEIDDLTTIPWLPPTQRELGLRNEFLVDHVRDVTACAVAFAETLLERRALPLSLDTVIAGALVHDVSKLAEFNGMDETAVYGLLGHPYYGVHVVARADLPIELAHIVLSHTSRTAVEPATIEAELVRRADEVAAAAIRSRATDDLRTV